jgi:micrococcal nuclease
MTTDGRFCPTCGRRRTGFYRYCNECGYDFDELAPRPDEQIARAAQAEPAASPLPPPPPPVLNAVSMERPAEPVPGPRWRIDERSIVRVAVVGLGALVVLGFAANLIGRPSRTSATPPPSAAIASPMVVESPVPSEVVATPSFAPTGPTRLAVVERVIDGDTIEVDIDGETYPLRYIGMDTPELDATDPAARQLADAATAANAALVEGEEVYLESDVSETDQFGRLLRDVWVIDSDGSMVLVNLELVRDGYAQVATFPPDVKYVELLTSAEQDARSQGRGLWSSDAPSPGAPSSAAPSSAPPAA